MNHKQLVQQMSEMKAELEKYQSELTNLRTQVTTYENVEAPSPVAGATSRRKLLKRMAIAGIGGIGAIGLAAAANPNYTVLAETAADNAVEAVGGVGGYGLKASGGLAPLFLGAGSGPGAPLAASGAHQSGELYVDSNGNLFYCSASGTPGTWRQVSGTNTAGSFHALSSPERFIDTRSGLGGSGILTRGTAVTFTLTNVNGQSGDASLRIPTGAIAIVGNITSVSPGATGFVTLYPADAANVPTTSNLNFTTGAVVGNNFTVGLSSSGQMKAIAQGGSSYQVHIIVDVFGYYL